MTVAPEVLALPIVRTLAGAINERREIEFEYGGLPRVVQPGALGFYLGGRGTLKLRGFLVGGATRSRTDILWRIFTVALEWDVVVTDRVFEENPPGYRYDDTQLGDIIAQLSVPPSS